MACAGAGPPALGPASTALCTASERVLFHCVLGERAVSLCASMAGPRIETLAYRYGVPGRIELSYVASSASGRRFAATAAPLAPRATVRQVWFDRGGYTYLLTQCVGGDCPQSAGLAVLRGEHVLSNRHSLRTAVDRA